MSGKSLLLHSGASFPPADLQSVHIFPLAVDSSVAGERQSGKSRGPLSSCLCQAPDAAALVAGDTVRPHVSNCHPSFPKVSGFPSGTVVRQCRVCAGCKGRNRFIHLSASSAFESQGLSLES